MYACKQATPNSKTKIANNKTNGNNTKINFILAITTTKSAIIWTNVWPAKRLALNLIAKLNALIIYDKISKIIIIGAKAKGTSKTKILKKWILCFKIPRKKIPKHILKEKYNVQTKWLVTAKL